MLLWVTCKGCHIWHKLVILRIYKDTLMQAGSSILKTIRVPVAGCCAATLAMAYSKMYNRKSRHLGVKHSMIRELITNRVVSIDFVRSQQNLADHLMKGLTRDLVLKSTEGMGLKSNQVSECQDTQLPTEETWMCLDPVEKEDEDSTSQWLIFLKKCLAGA
ncbi:hypothetical protein Tco_0721764 [Tanacetum coccineum]